MLPIFLCSPSNSTGIGRTGVFTLVYAAMQEVLHGNGLTDIPGLARRMLQKRRLVLYKKEQLQCCYQALLQFAEGFLEKRTSCFSFLLLLTIKTYQGTLDVVKTIIIMLLGGADSLVCRRSPQNYFVQTTPNCLLDKTMQIA